MTKYSETVNLFNQLLVTYDIPFSLGYMFGGVQWKFPAYPDGDIILHDGSYGHEEGYLESYRMPWDEDDVSVALPHEMVRRLLGWAPNREAERDYDVFDALDSMDAMLSTDQ